MTNIMMPRNDRGHIRLYAGVSMLWPKATAVICDASGKHQIHNSCAGPLRFLPGLELAVTDTCLGAPTCAVQIGDLHLTAADIEFMLIGMPDMEDAAERKRFEEMLEERWPYPGVRIVVEPDLKIALDLITPRGPGYVINSAVRDRMRWRDGLGSEQMADGIGCREKLGIGAITAVARAIRGGPWTTLVPRFDALFGYRGVCELEAEFGRLNAEEKAYTLDEIVPMIADAAWRADRISRGLFASVAYCYAESAIPRLRRLHAVDDAVPIGVYGDVWKYEKLLRQPFIASVRRVVPNAFIDDRTYDLEHAAALRAVQLCND